MTAPAFVAASTSSVSSEATPSVVTIPSHSNGDLLIIMVSVTTGVDPMTAINTPSGWTKEVDLEAGTSSAVRFTCFKKVGDGVESSVNITISGDAIHSFAAVCAAYSSALTALDVTGSDSQESGVDMTAPSVVTTVANTRVIYAFVFDGDASSDADVDTDAGFNGTKRGFAEAPATGGNNGCSVALSDESQAAAAASNTCVFSTNADDDGGCAITIALAPSGPSALQMQAYQGMNRLSGGFRE